ncbi:MAG: succinylglutamate desuccinylase/aspartoacylase family protein [Clostridia bacterium]|nr:succinylglutamate desuccinylase/aspartoacylase family protein [Clostridia bacterium]
MWTICGQTLNAGEKRQVNLCPGVSGYEMPATLVCGAEPGVTLVVTAGIHSGEYPATPAVARVAKAVEPGALKGNLLLVHCVNTSGFRAKSNGLVPEDGANLNGNYPGDPNGTTGQRIADWFVREVFPHAGFLLDMHSGGSMEPLTPCLFFPRADKVRRASLEAAKALDIPYLIESTATKGEYSYAANFCGVPGLLVERGHSGYCRDAWVKDYERDLWLMLIHLGMYDAGVSRETCAKRVYEKTIYLTAAEAGLWRPAIREDQRVQKGELLGRVEDFYGNPVSEYRAEADGTVFYYTAGLAINPGDPLVAYGLEEFARGE